MRSECSSKSLVSDRLSLLIYLILFYLFILHQQSFYSIPVVYGLLYYLLNRNIVGFVLKTYRTEPECYCGGCNRP